MSRNDEAANDQVVRSLVFCEVKKTKKVLAVFPFDLYIIKRYAYEQPDFMTIGRKNRREKEETLSESNGNITSARGNSSYHSFVQTYCKK